MNKLKDKNSMISFQPSQTNNVMHMRATVLQVCGSSPVGTLKDPTKAIRLRQIDSVFPVILSSQNLASQPKKKNNLPKKSKCKK